MTPVRSVDPLHVVGEALACIEIASIARGVVVLDQMAKRARTTIVAARTLSPGRYLVVVSGPVAEVEEAFKAGVDVALEDVVDSVILRDPPPGLTNALARAATKDRGVPLDSIAIVETTTISSALLGVERALKGTDVRLLELRLGTGLSGKGVFTLTGALHMIEVAREVIEANVGHERIVRIELIPQPHPDLPQCFLASEGFEVRGQPA